MNGAVMTIARYHAREFVKQELRSQGIKLQQVEASEISRAAIQYIDDHPEIITFATERYWDCVKRGVLKPPRNRRKSRLRLSLKLLRVAGKAHESTCSS